MTNPCYNNIESEERSCENMYKKYRNAKSEIISSYCTVGLF